MSDANSLEGLLEIGAVAQQTGLPPATIRAWENRYEAVTPVRSQTNRRLYTVDDARRLSLLRDLVESGHRIGQIARLPSDRLTEFARQQPTVAAQETLNDLAPPPAALSLKPALRAVLSLEGSGLRQALDDAAVSLGRVALIEEFLVPLMHAIGNLYQAKRLRAVHEHLASTVVRAYTERMSSAVPASESDPLVLVSTPAGQLHELGALLVAVSARIEGWRATYLGPNLPAEEIALAARDTDTRVIALGISFPVDDRGLDEELAKLLRMMPHAVWLLLGGAASAGYAARLNDPRVIHVDTLPEFRERLSQLRQDSAKQRDYGQSS